MEEVGSRVCVRVFIACGYATWGIESPLRTESNTSPGTVPPLSSHHHPSSSTNSPVSRLRYPTSSFKMTATAQSLATSSKTHLTLKGSTAMVSEFFNYSVQSLLYQRGIYPNEDFRQIKKYGLPMLVTTDSGLEKYLNDCLQQVTRWIEEGKLTRLVVAIVEKDSGETRERWQFDLEVTSTGTDAPDGKENVG